MKLRKHIRADVLQTIAEEVSLGVPVARAMSKHLPSLSITRPTVVVLLRTLTEAQNAPLARAERLTSSLFPAWLEEHGSPVQEQPNNYDYIGCFPEGSWVCRT